MRVGTVMKPGQPGTKKLQAKYGERLLAVRYRYDEANQQRHTTVELLEDSASWQPGVHYQKAENPSAVAVRVDWAETELRRRIAQHGGRWDAQRKLWILPTAAAQHLQLIARSVPIAIHAMRPEKSHQM